MGWDSHAGETEYRQYPVHVGPLVLGFLHRIRCKVAQSGIGNTNH
ncbi:hypothetical protein SAMN03080618_00532 [Aquamicrobium aerolatum DSM 21857]|uniref:Uncharacterized protein n=1 Tax=Aquamicrobium aerolatum DSM 21857 TaxID=1121003 RepID=A0A1I3IDI8_9HYPH|nr:hypothetical protein SAMN03080618_00532 [Aquamicrobium aerolatum DSM 21857]